MNNIQYILTRMLNGIGLYTQRQIDDAYDSSDFWKAVYESDIERKDKEIEYLKGQLSIRK